MKTKARIVLNSLADLPANLLTIAVSLSQRTVNASKQIIATPARFTRRELRAARRRSAEFVRNMHSRARAPLADFTPWPRGGINE